MQVNSVDSLQVAPHAHMGSQVLLIRVGGILACIDLEAVERTFSLVELQPFPGAAPWVAGIMNYAGNSLPVVDIALRLALPVQPYTMETPIIVCTHQSRRIGLIVSDIVGNQMPDPGDVQLSNALQRPGAAFRASVHTSLGLAFLLDTGWLVNADLYEFAPNGPERHAQNARIALASGAC